MYTLINGSSKLKESNSANFLDYISKYLDHYKTYTIKNDNLKDITNSINASDTIVIAFPLYVDSPNTHTIRLLDYIYDYGIKKNKNLYIIINCGFREGIHNITALNIIKNWSRKVKLNYMGALLIGAGEIVGRKKYKFITRKARKELKDFSICIKNRKKTSDIITSMDLLNNKTYCMLANISWQKKIKNRRSMRIR